MSAKEKTEYNKIFIGGLFSILVAIIGVIGVVISKENDIKTPEIKITNEQHVHQDSYINYVKPKEVKRIIKQSKIIFIKVIDEETKIEIPNVNYTLGKINGVSDIEGKIEIKTNLLNSKNDYDMFQIKLKKDGYNTENYNIGIQEDQILKIKKNEAIIN